MRGKKKTVSGVREVKDGLRLGKEEGLVSWKGKTSYKRK